MAKNNQLMSDDRVIDFRVWLIKNHLDIKTFAERCGVSRQYISQIVNQKFNVTNSVVSTFAKGGYDLNAELRR